MSKPWGLSCRVGPSDLICTSCTKSEGGQGAKLHPSGQLSGRNHVLATQALLLCATEGSNQTYSFTVDIEQA